MPPATRSYEAINTEANTNDRMRHGCMQKLLKRGINPPQHHIVFCPGRISSKGLRPFLCPHSRNSEFQPRLKSNHSGSAVAAQPHAQQAGRRRSRVGERSESSLRGGLSRNAGLHHARQAKIRMVEDIEKLASNRSFTCSVKGNHFVR